MNKEIVNPFKQTKITDWAKKAQNRFKEEIITNNESNILKNNSNIISSNKLNNSKNFEIKKNNNKNNLNNKKIERVSKSFKIYKCDLAKKFDKRVNKLQVKFDDLDYEKNYVDSGKYIMFLMALSEEFKLYDLYEEISLDCKININKNKIKKLFCE